MSASRVGKASLKKAQGSIPGPPRVKDQIPHPTQKPKSKTLPKRANPYLVNLPSSASNPSHGVSPRILTFMGISLLSLSTYCGYLYASYTREVNQAQSLTVPKDVSDRYNHTAGTFDADVEMSEKVMRLGRKRRDLVQLARGNVMEVSCGTGRNLEYYDLSQVQGPGPGQGQGQGQGQGLGLLKGCRSITFIDLSPQMVEVTRQKFERMHPRCMQRASFAVADAGRVSPASLPVPVPVSDAAAAAGAGAGRPRHFDTIVQTMGLCSMPDPVGTLRHLGSITEPQHGQILLLEHGRSYYDWLNRILDNLAPAHADRHGCWWNRNIGKIIQESGLEVVEEKRWHFGTTWRYVLRPKRD